MLKIPQSLSLNRVTTAKHKLREQTVGFQSTQIRISNNDVATEYRRLQAGGWDDKGLRKVETANS
jgi:hypothetical protein